LKIEARKIEARSLALGWGFFYARQKSDAAFLMGEKWIVRPLKAGR
jgi:hypothetical protein